MEISQHLVPDILANLLYCFLNSMLYASVTLALLVASS